MVEHAPLAHGITLAWEGFGDRGPPVLLIMGLGSQMLLWHERFCERLAGMGHRVVRYDNRDVGLSTRLDALGAPSMRRMVAAALLGPERVGLQAPYLLRDLARDAVGLMDHLGWERAHVVGTSMGGMVAQELALEHPERVATLTSIMSAPRPILPHRRGIAVLLRRPRPGEEVDHFVWAFQTIGGPHLQRDTERLREVGRQVVARGPSPGGLKRQLAAVLASGDRTERLRRMRIPTLVIHGAVDPMVPLRFGRATAAAIPGSRLVVHPDMGHDLAEALWPRLLGDITEHARRHG